MLKFESMVLDRLAKELDTCFINGLSKEQVQKRLNKYGKNTLDNTVQKTLFDHLIESLEDVTIMILIVATILSTYVSYSSNPRDFTEPIVIFGIVVLNLFLSIREQKQAEKSMEALKEYHVSESKVIREGKLIQVETEQLVPGDVLKLAVGDRIPADARLIDQINLQVDESLLTGESEPVLKETTYVPTNGDIISDKKNMLYSGALVVNGKATAIITETGMQTEIGKISSLLTENKNELSPLQVRMQKLGKSLSTVAILSAFCALVISWVQGFTISNMLMISISLAVAAIPEVLPVVVTISLSYGISYMAKKNALVRTPSAVETVGNISVICSDKTGTLTQNKMKVEKLWSVNDAPSQTNKQFNKREEELIKMMFLASSADIRENKGGNPTEIAVLNLLNEKIDGVDDFTKNYERIHEIPFDSSRKKMTVVYKVQNEYISITKGAFDRLPLKVSEDIKQQAEAVHDQFTNQALRVIGVGYKTFSMIPEQLVPDELESNLTFCGFVGIIDPPRNESAQSVRIAAEAGIKTIMITGDHLNTAKAIADNIGILKDG